MMTVDERIQAYLDGTLPGEEARAFERELLDPEVSRLFRRRALAARAHA